MSEIDPKLSRLYREASSEEPPAAVDAAILAAARKQAPRRAGARAPGRSWWRSWMAPASAVATLALGLSLALLIERERPDMVEDLSRPPAAAMPQSAPPARAGAAAKAADAAAPAAPKKEIPVPERAAPAPVAPPVAAARRAEPPASTLAAPKAAMESNVADEAAADRLGATAGAAAPLRKQAVQRSPEAWLEEIGRLRRAGREQEAEEQLAQFRKAYPAYAVPQDLLTK